MNQTRFSRRMGEHYPYGAEYGCAITRHASKHRAADWALYIVGVIGAIAAIVFNNFGA
jgi:hypothetical protein